MNILTPAQLVAYKRKGWRIFQPGFDMSYKSHWDTPWFIIREFFQNALDEHDQAGIKAVPSLSLGLKGVVIGDRGRGLGAESLLLREAKGEGDLRGRFGEGLKFACIAAVRLGYTPLIESANVVIEAHASPLTMGKVEATLLTFLYKEQASPRVGTTVTIQGYRGDLFKDRFTTFLDKPLTTVSNIIGRFSRQDAVYDNPKGRLYVGDIYIRDLEKAEFSYNLWGLELNPDRVSEISNSELLKRVACLWALVVDNKTLALKALSTMTTEETFESNAGWDWWCASKLQPWQEAWVALFGSRAVLSTDKTLSKIVEGFGYKSVGEGWNYKVRTFLKAAAIPTDSSIAGARMKELTAPKVIPDNALRQSQATNLKLLRFLSTACEKCARGGKKPFIYPATIPRDPRTGDSILGLCSPDEDAIYLSTEILETEEDALSVFYHEMGHWTGGRSALDGSIAHTRAVQEVAATISLIIQARYAEIAEMLGAPVPVTAVPVSRAVPSPVSSWRLAEWERKAKRAGWQG